MERYLKDEPQQQQPSSSPLCSSSAAAALRRAESFDMLSSSIQPASYLAPDSVNSPMWPWSFKQEPVDPDTDPDDGCQLLRAHKHHHQIALRYGFHFFFLLFSFFGDLASIINVRWSGWMAHHSIRWIECDI